MTTALHDLAHRLAEATGPDRELDAEIAWAFTPDDRKSVIQGVRCLAVLWWADGGRSYRELEALTAENDRLVPFYTASLDAAEALMRAVLPPASVHISRNETGDGFADIFINHRYVSYVGPVPTAPLAWCAAVVAAVMAREGGV